MASVSPSITYGGRSYGVGDVVEVYMQYSALKKTFIARDDSGIVVLPEIGSRMIPEMIEARARMIYVKGKIILIKKTRKGTYYAIIRPTEWKPITT